MALVGISACRAYEPRPLQPERHRAAWAERGETEALRRAVAEWAVDRAGDAEPFEPGDGIEWHEGRLVALVHHPDVRLARQRAAVAAASAAHAGRWPDPELSFEVLAALDGGPKPWLLAPGLAFALPWSGRLAAERDAAAAEARAAALAVTEAEWRAAREVELAWIAWSAELARLAAEQRFAAALESPARAAERLATAGEIDPPEAALFALEAARQQSAARRQERRVEEALRELSAALGLPPEVPARLVPMDLATLPDALDAEAADDVLRHPTLARLTQEYEVTERALRLEVRRQFPDLSLGPLFESDGGESRLGLHGSLPLPFTDRNRAAITTAEARRELAREAFEVEMERLLAQWSVAGMRARRIAAERAEFDDVLAPLAHSQVTQALHLLELGEGSALFVLESLGRAHTVELEQLEAHAADARARAELIHLAGPPHPEWPLAPARTP